MANYDIDRPLKLGEVRTIRSDGGRKLEQAELLFSPVTIAKFNVNRAKNRVDLLMDNTEFKYQDLNCALLLMISCFVSGLLCRTVRDPL